MVRILDKKELLTIYNTAELTNHAERRMKQRGAELEDILSSPFAYVNTDGSINVAKNEYEYFVIEKKKSCYLIITFKEASKNGVSVVQKYLLALNGYSRSENKRRKNK